MLQSIRSVFFILTPLLFGVNCHSETELDTKRFDVSFYHFISLDSTGASKEKSSHVDGYGNPKRWEDLSKADLSKIDWLEGMGVPFCDVEGARLVYHEKRSLVEAIETKEELCGSLEVTNTPTNLGILEYKLVSRTNEYLRLQGRGSEQIAIEGFPMPSRIGAPSYTGLYSSDLVKFFQDWNAFFPNGEVHEVRVSTGQGGRFLYVRYDPVWDRELGFWKFKAQSFRFSEHVWRGEYDSSVVQSNMDPKSSTEIFISFLNAKGIIVGDDIDQAEFHLLINELRKKESIHFSEDLNLSGSQAINVMTSIERTDANYFLSFHSSYHLVCGIENGALKIITVMQY